jgi:hypothetical protein
VTLLGAPNRRQRCALGPAYLYVNAHSPRDVCHVATSIDAEASHRPYHQTLASYAYKNPTGAPLSEFPTTTTTFVVPSSTLPLYLAEAPCSPHRPE